MNKVGVEILGVSTARQFGSVLGEADGRGILGAGEAQIQRDGSEISGDGWPVRGDQAQAQPPAAVGQRGTGLEGWADTGAVDVDGVVV